MDMGIFLAEECVIGNCSYFPNSMLLLVVWILWKYDRLIWKPENNGIFSFKSFYKCLLFSSCDLNLGMPFLWSGIALLKVENLIWLINHDRLCCKDWLCHLGIIPPDQNLCSRCGMAIESISHIFVLCSFSWKVWYWFLKWWGILFCLPPSVPLLLLEWKYMVFRNFQKRFWTTIDYAILWLLWLARNENLFDNKDLSIESICCLILHRVSLWLKVAGSSFLYTGLNLLILSETIKSWSTHPSVPRPSIQ